MKFRLDALGVERRSVPLSLSLSLSLSPGVLRLRIKNKLLLLLLLLNDETMPEETEEALNVSFWKVSELRASEQSVLQPRTSASDGSLPGDSPNRLPKLRSLQNPRAASPWPKLWSRRKQPSRSEKRRKQKRKQQRKKRI